MAPVAIFAYKRPDHLKRLVLSLSRCEGFDETPIKIFVDGPKSGKDVAAVEECRKTVEGLVQPNITWQFSEINLGLKQSISAGVTKICHEAGRVIVLEDDLVVSSSALTYFNAGLRRYIDEPKVWSIGGYAYDAPALRSSTKALVLPFTHPWGWATWQRAWSQFDVNAPISQTDLKSPAFKNAFDMGGLYPFSTLLRMAEAGKVNSWFIRWYYCAFRNAGVSVYPSQRVVDNFGFSEGGTHSGSFTPYDLVVKRPPLFEGEIALPTPDHVDYWALDAMKKGRELRMHRAIARAGAMRRGEWAFWR